VPFPNEHALRLRPPALFDPDSFRRTNGGTLFGGNLNVPDSISLIWGKLKGRSAANDPVILQALRFPKSRWTVDAAKSWIDKNIKRGIFEPASGSENNTEPITTKDLEQAVLQGDLDEYNQADVIEYDEVVKLETSIDFNETEIHDTEVLASQIHQLMADNQEDVNTTDIDTSTSSHDEETQNVDGVEVFQIGTHKGIPWTHEDLEEIAANFSLLRDQIKPPVKLGHNEEQELVKNDGHPAAGWVVKLTKVGDKLVANIADVPRKIAQIIKNRGYKRVSSEIYTNLKDSTGKEHGKVFKGLALLGGDIPHLKNLDDIVAQYDSDGSFPDNEIRRVVIMAEDLKDKVDETTNEETIEEKDKKTTDETQETTEDKTKTDETNESTDDKEKEKQEEKMEETDETATDDNATVMAEQAKVIAKLQADAKARDARDVVRNQVVDTMQAQLKAQTDSANLLSDEQFLADLTQQGIFPPSMKTKAVALLTECRKIEANPVSYFEDGAEAPTETNPLELVKKLFSEWPKGMSLTEQSKGTKIVAPGSGNSDHVTHNDENKAVFGEDLANKIIKYMEDHDGVVYDDAMTIVYQEAGLL